MGIGWHLMRYRMQTSRPCEARSAIDADADSILKILEKLLKNENVKDEIVIRSYEVATTLGWDDQRAASALNSLARRGKLVRLTKKAYRCQM